MTGNRIALAGEGSICVVRGNEVIVGKEEYAHLEVGDTVVIAVAKEGTPNWLLKAAAIEKALESPNTTKGVTYRDIFEEEIPDFLIVPVVSNPNGFGVPQAFAKL
ncbi:hypothetical protein PSACC_00174 [Paramicrosporidium saccamoebae]|uniref:Uncharacterized protein n=1 Tax=Paramicrosporidium saccamoebae TaxID=1246581 RepID=A0A2H9TQG1_9FUNG|nr:hypothetical protein PSACC_00174 [Paramicrosporidium saccamoebae]